MSGGPALPIIVDSATTKSVLIQTYFNETHLGWGTGFVIDSRRGPLLISARHVFTGRHQDSSLPLHSACGIPNRILVWLIHGPQLGSWQACEQPILTASEQPLWIEHPTFGALADVAALPLHVPDSVRVKPYDLGVPQVQLRIGPADVVSVVGFPFGLSAGGRFAIWVTGFVASDIGLNYGEYPRFLIDCRSRPGQSGSPVVARREGTYNTTQGVMVGAGQVTELLGVYSGRVNEESDLGFVWKLSVLRELVDALE